MSDMALKLIGGFVTLLIGLFGGGSGVIWFLNNRAAEDHDAKQKWYNDLKDRVDELEARLSVQHRELAQLQQELAQAERVKADKDAKITRLQAQVETLQSKVRRLEHEDCG